MIKRQFTHCLLRPEQLRSSSDRFKVVGVFNPGVAVFDDEVVILARVVEQPIAVRDGFEPSPRFVMGEGFVVDWLEQDDIDYYDPRVYHIRSTGLERLRFISYLKVFRSKDGKTVRDLNGPVIMPTGPYEEYGIEDPRITKIDDTYYITYVAVSRHGVATCLLVTEDFERFQRRGIIFCPENKDVLLFPEKVQGEYVAMHRPTTSIQFRPPEMWIAHSPDLLHWGRHEQMVGAGGEWETSRIGGGTPPIRTDGGWLTLYHGSQRRENDRGPGIYTAGALLLDLEYPRTIIARSHEPIMKPEADFEIEGFVRDVVFPTGIVERGNQILVYYGAADECIGVTAWRRKDLLDALVPMQH